MVAVTPPADGLAGRVLLTYRVTLGLSLRRVAAALGIAPNTLRLAERGDTPLSEDVADVWLLAISRCAADRLVELAGFGIVPDDLVGLDLGELFKSLTSPASAPAGSAAAEGEAHE